MTLLSSLVVAALAAGLLIATAAFRMGRAPLVPATAAAVAGLAVGALLAIGDPLRDWVYPAGVIAAALACSAAREHLREKVVESGLTGAVMASWALSLLTLERSDALPSTVLWMISGAAGGLAWGAIRAPLPRLLLVVATAAAAYLAGLLPLSGLRMASDPAAPVLITSGILALIGVASELWQLSRLRSTIGEEAAWGIVDAQLTERLISPVRRFLPPPQYDRQLWLEMVRTSRRLGERRLRQRQMQPSAARVQQIEIIRLRTRLMELQMLHRGANSPREAEELG